MPAKNTVWRTTPGARRPCRARMSSGARTQAAAAREMTAERKLRVSSISGNETPTLPAGSGPLGVAQKGEGEEEGSIARSGRDGVGMAGYEAPLEPGIAQREESLVEGGR